MNAKNLYRYLKTVKADKTELVTLNNRLLVRIMKDEKETYVEII